MRKWTDKQEDAIKALNGTVLVSAAAGSGKTSVLVERLIGRLTDRENPCLADRVLVVTYTNAAAAEMKERVEKSIAELIKKDPFNTYLKRQQMLIPSMNISTVHSFCSKLIREYFYLCEISPDYKIIPDKQRMELMEECVSDAVKKRFEKGDFTLANTLSSEKSDRGLFETVFKVYEFMNTSLFPEDWMQEKSSKYTGNIEMSPWGKVLINHLKETVTSCLKLSNQNLKIISFDEKIDAAYSPAVNEDIKVLEKILELCEVGLWEDIHTALKEIKWKRLTILKGADFDELKVKSKGIRDYIKDQIKKSAKLFEDSESVCKEVLEQNHEYIEKLKDLTLEFAENFKQRKKERKFVDYGDLEHMVVSLLLEKKDGVVSFTKTALDLSLRFDEIMVDEYQDTNEVQDYIFRALSKNDSNKFMVGDLKQCIYSFRRANPYIFSSYKDSFEDYDREKDNYPSVVNLDKNFRSRKNVIDSVNFMFSVLMSKSVGGTDYGSDESLKFAADYEEGEGYETQLDFLEKTDLPTEINEARHIASIINENIEKGLVVNDKGTKRKACYKDFCILLRNANNCAHIYADELIKNGIPANTEIKKGFFESPEVLGVLAFLQVIDNPNQDVALLSTLLGPIYGFEPADLIFMKNQNKYTAVTKDKTGKFDKFLSDLREYRLMASSMPSDKFIDLFYLRTGYIQIVSAMKDSKQKVANLMMLKNYSSQYEDSGYKGLNGFVKFMERMSKSRTDMEGASVALDDDNYVKIMSIHKSKGLEFPVTIVAGCGKLPRNETSDVVLNSELGIGIKVRDGVAGVKYNNFVRNAIMLKNHKDELSEELRVLYVAATRAREKLIFVSTMTNINSKIGTYSALLTDGEKVDSYTVNSTSTAADRLLICALKHPDGRMLRHSVGADDSCVSYQSFSPWNVRVISEEGKSISSEKVEAQKQSSDKEIIKKIEDRLNFGYPHKDINLIPAKLTATELAKKKIGIKTTLSRPSFLSAKGLTPSERGTALHGFMQFCKFENVLENAEKERDRLIEQGYMREEEGRSVELKKVINFLNSDIGKRMLKSGEIMRELRFSAPVKASVADENYPDDIEVVLQGIVDCAFVEDGKIYIIDFKTDRINQEEIFKENYEMQLRLYKNALEKVKNMPVGGCYLYSFHLEKNIVIK